MGNHHSHVAECPADLVFHNIVVMRTLVGMLPLKDIRNFRRVNTTTNRMSCGLLHDRGNTTFTISDGTAMTCFLERMQKRREVRCCYSSVKLQVCGIPLASIQRFCTDMKPHVRKLSIDLQKIPYWWYVLMNKGLEAGSWNEGKMKTIQILESFPDVEELHLSLADDEDEYIMNGAEWYRLPRSFPKLRLFHFTHLDFHLLPRPPLMQHLVTTFFVAVVQRSHNLDEVIIERDDAYLPVSFRVLPALLAANRRPALTMQLPFTWVPGPGFPVVLDVRSQLISDLIGTGFNRLRYFDCGIYSATNDMVGLLNHFLALQAQFLKSLSLVCCVYETGVNPPLPLAFPVFHNLTYLNLVFWHWPVAAIPQCTPPQFPRINEVKRRDFRGITAFIHGDVLIHST